MLIPDFLANRFSVIENRFLVLVTFIKIYYYIKKITLCIMRCNVCTRKAVSTPIWSFSRFNLNEVMNIVYCVFYRKTVLIKTAQIKQLPNSNHHELVFSVVP